MLFFTVNIPAGSTFSAYTSGGYLQSYRYNIRGQLLSINNSTLTNDSGVTNSDTNDLFGMAFLYDQQYPNLNNTPSYDGKLTGVKWMSQDGVGYQRAFRYTYDQVSRYTGSSYAENVQEKAGKIEKEGGYFSKRSRVPHLRGPRCVLAPGGGFGA